MKIRWNEQWNKKKTKILEQNFIGFSEWTDASEIGRYPCSAHSWYVISMKSCSVKLPLKLGIMQAVFIAEGSRSLIL